MEYKIQYSKIKNIYIQIKEGKVIVKAPKRVTREEILASNPKAVEEYLAGNIKNINALIGQSMKALHGKADPQTVRNLLAKLLDEMK